MKKLLLIFVVSIVSISSLWAQGSYMGFGLEGSQSFSSSQKMQSFAQESVKQEFNGNAYGAKILVGGEVEGALRTNLTFGVSQYQNDLFPKDFLDEDKTKDNGYIFSFGLEIQKGFPISATVVPTIIGGFEFGFMDIDGYAQKSADFSAWKFGAGMLNRTGEAEIETQIFYRYRSWGNYNYSQASTTNVTVQENTVNFSIGLNFHY